MENKQKPIVIKKIHRLETNLIVILLGILVLSVGIVWIGYSNNKIKALESSVEKSLTTPVSVDEKEISYYRELSNKTDAAIERIIVIVGLFTGLLSLVGLLLAFKVPLGIEKKIEKVEKTVNDIKNTAKEVKFQSAISAQIDLNIHNNKSSVSRGRTRVKKISKIIDEFPDNPLLYMARAKVYVQLGRTYQGFGNTTNRSVNYYNLALADYSLAVTFGADVGECNNNMGMIYKELGKIKNNYKDSGDIKNALTCYNKAIDNDAKNNTFFINRGICYGILGKYQDALKDFETAIALDDEELSA